MVVVILDKHSLVRAIHRKRGQSRSETGEDVLEACGAGEGACVAPLFAISIVLVLLLYR